MVTDIEETLRIIRADIVYSMFCDCNVPCEIELIIPETSCDQEGKTVFALAADRNIHVVHLCNDHFQNNHQSPVRLAANAMAHQMVSP